MEERERGRGEGEREGKSGIVCASERGQKRESTGAWERGSGLERGGHVRDHGAQRDRERERARQTERQTDDSSDAADEDTSVGLGGDREMEHKNERQEE